MRAGELRQRISIQYKSVTQNSYNEEVITWPTLATLWAKVETTSGAEVIDLDAATATLTHKITVRYLMSIMPTMRVVWNDRILSIVAVQEDNRRRETVLMCGEVIEAAGLVYPTGTSTST